MFIRKIGYIVSGNTRGIVIWELATGQCVRVLKTQADKITSVAISPDGRYAISQEDTEVILWKIETGELNIDMMDFPFGEMLDKIESLVSPKVNAKGLKFAIQLYSELPAQIHTDSIKRKIILGMNTHMQSRTFLSWPWM